MATKRQADKAGLSESAKRGIFGLKEFCNPVSPEPATNAGALIKEIPFAPMTCIRIKRELAQIMRCPPSGCQVRATDNVLAWLALIQGPKNTPYQGGLFKVLVSFPRNYPFVAPGIRFQTKIFHCNISNEGDIGDYLVDFVWLPTRRVANLLEALRALLMEPDPGEYMERNVATMYQMHRKQHDFNARRWTEIYAKPENVLSSI